MAKKIQRQDIIAENLFGDVKKETLAYLDALIALKNGLKDVQQEHEQILKVNKSVLNGNVKTYSEYKKVVKATNDVEVSVESLTKTKKTQQKVDEELIKTTKKVESELAKEVATSKEVKKQLDDINGSLESNIALQTRRATRLKQLATQQKELSNALKRGKISTEQYNKRSAQLTKTQLELKTANQKLGFTIRAQIKESQTASTSFDQQAQRLGQLKSAYRKLNEEERNNVKIGGSLSRSIKLLDKQVKENNASIGNFQGNVGNYKDSVKEALAETGLFSHELGIMNKITVLVTKITGSKAEATNKATAATKASNVASKRFTKTQKALNVVLKASPFFLLAAALGAVVVFLKKTQVGAELLSKGFSGLNAFLDVFIDRISGVGSGIMDIIKGDFSKGIDKITASFKGLGKEIAEEVKQATLLEEQLIKIRKAETILEAQRALTRGKIKELNKITEDTTETFEKRSAAVTEAIALEQRLLSVQTETVKQRINNSLGEIEVGEKFDEVLQLIQTEFSNVSDAAELADKVIERLGISESTIEDLEAFTEDVVKLGTIQQESLEMQTTLTNKLNIIETQRLKARKELLSLDEETNTTSDDLKAADKLFEAESTNNKKRIDEKEVLLSLDEKIAKQQEEMNAKDAKAIELRKQKTQELIETTENLAASVVDGLNQKDERLAESLDKEIADRERSIDTQQRLAEKGLSNSLAFEQQAKANAEVEKERLAEKAQKREKALAYFNLLSGYAEKNPDTAAARAFAQIAIAETLVGFFNDGIEGIGGDNSVKWRNTGTDDYLAAVNKGESIVTTEATNKYAGLPTAMNQGKADEWFMKNMSGKLNQKSKVHIDSNGQVILELRNVRQAITGKKETSINLDNLGNVIRTEVKDGVKRTIIKKNRARL